MNYPENSIIYFNQGYLTLKNNKKMFHSNYFILGQIIEVLNASEEISCYVCKERKVKIIRPKNEPTIVEFLGLYETIGFIVVRRDSDKHFLNYGCNENRSKLLYSFYKCRISNSFGGTLLIWMEKSFVMVFNQICLVLPVTIRKTRLILLLVC